MGGNDFGGLASEDFSDDDEELGKKI